MGARILIIEDNPANLELARYLLHASGHTVDCASAGHTGIARARAAQPDLVLSDIGMPDIDGYEVLRRLRADPACRHIPIVALTAYSMPGDQARALSSGFNGYLSKPVDPETFVRQVEAFLPAWRGA